MLKIKQTDMFLQYSKYMLVELSQCRYENIIVYSHGSQKEKLFASFYGDHYWYTLFDTSILWYGNIPCTFSLYVAFGYGRI